MNRRSVVVALAIVLAVVLAACGSSGSKSGGGTPGTTAATSATPAESTAPGRGVTADTVKVGVSLVDFDCIKQFIDSIRVNQQENYDAFFKYINDNGGVAGRKIEPVYHTFCPIGNSEALTLCTKFAEDDKVFAVLGNFIDFAGDAQTCLAKNHDTPIITYQLTQDIMSKSPGGMIILPGTTKERTGRVTFKLLKDQHTLDGKKVGVLGETVSRDVVKSTVEPGIDSLGVERGTTAILNITNGDTTTPQAQLDSYIERWKNEGTNALYITGTQVLDKQFVEKIRAAMPDITLVTDDETALRYAQEEATAGKKPNPYEGIIEATNQTRHQTAVSANWKWCADTYKKETGKTAPGPEDVVPDPSDPGKTLDTYGSISDACQILMIFDQIGDKIGKNLNTTNWRNTVDAFGPIVNRGGTQYASLHKGKYDVEDGFTLVAYDSSIGKAGDWKSITPIENVPDA